MKIYLSYLLTALLIIGYSCLTITYVFSQEKQNQSRSETPESVTVRTNDNLSPVKGITTGRARSLVGAVICLISLGIGWRAKSRSADNINKSRKLAIIALILGLVGIVLSLLHLFITAGAVFGSGSGKAGAIVAFVFGLIGIGFASATLRSRPNK